MLLTASTVTSTGTTVYASDHVGYGEGFRV